MYLAAAGIGAIEIVDDDHVDLSNLQRQVQFGEADVGLSKAVILAARLETLNANVAVSVCTKRFEAGDTLSGSILIDATDNYQARYDLNALAHTSGRVMVHGAAARWSGQASVFASGVEPTSPCYRCWVPEEPPEVDACDTVGVAGPVTGVVGTRMALEVIKLVTGAGSTLMGKIWLLDGLTGEARNIGLRKDPLCLICG